MNALLQTAGQVREDPVTGDAPSTGQKTTGQDAPPTGRGEKIAGYEPKRNPK